MRNQKTVQRWGRNMEKLSISRKLDLYRNLATLNDNYTEFCVELGYSKSALPNWKDAITKLSADIKEDLFNGALDGTVSIPSGGD